MLPRRAGDSFKKKGTTLPSGSAKQKKFRQSKEELFKALESERAKKFEELELAKLRSDEEVREEKRRLQARSNLTNYLMTISEHEAPLTPPTNDPLVMAPPRCQLGGLQGANEMYETGKLSASKKLPGFEKCSSPSSPLGMRASSTPGGRAAQQSCSHKRAQLEHSGELRAIARKAAMNEDSFKKNSFKYDRAVLARQHSELMAREEASRHAREQEERAAKAREERREAVGKVLSSIPLAKAATTFHHDVTNSWWYTALSQDISYLTGWGSKPATSLSGIGPPPGPPPRQASASVAVRV